jgi:hypothetical protein
MIVTQILVLTDSKLIMVLMIMAMIMIARGSSTAKILEKPANVVSSHILMSLSHK